MKDKDKKGLVL